MANCIAGKRSPFTVEIHDDFLSVVRTKLGLPAHSFALPLLRMFSIKSGFAIAYKQMCSMFCLLPASFWMDVQSLAAKNSRGLMFALHSIH